MALAAQTGTEAIRPGELPRPGPARLRPGLLVQSWLEEVWHLTRAGASGGPVLVGSHAPARHPGKVEDLVARLSNLDYDAHLERETLLDRVRDETKIPTAELVLPLANLMALEELGE